MEFLKKLEVLFLVITLSTYCLQTTFAKSIIIENNDTSPNDIQFSRKIDDESKVIPVIPGHIQCEFMEVTEAEVCKDHCLPKGYSYGLCVNYTCSCV